MGLKEQKKKLKEAIAANRKELNTLRKEIEQINKKTAIVDASDVKESPDILAKPVRFLKGHYHKIYTMEWSKTMPKLLASAGQDGKVLVWNAWTGSKIDAINLTSNWVMSSALSPDTKRVATGGLDSITTVHKLQKEGAPITPESIKNRPSKRLRGHEGFISHCEFIDETTLIAASGDASISLWYVDDAKMIQRFKGHEGDVLSLSVRDENIFLSSSIDCSNKLWDKRTKKGCVQTFFGHTSDVNDIKFFRGNLSNSFVSGSDDGTLRLWDVRTKAQLQEYHSDKIGDGIGSVQPSQSGKLLMFGTNGSDVHMFNTLSARYAGVLGQNAQIKHENRVSCVGLNSSGEVVCSASWDKNLICYS